MTPKDNQSFPPCKLACPILTDAREYIQLIAERKYKEAYASIRRQNPLPGVCGRICTHPCEAACKRGQVDEPVAISALKRFPADGPWADEYEGVAAREPSGFKVAVIGSGPAGLSAAHDLALMGHAVTIFEALPVLGGMLRVGVPEYRLPKEVLEGEIRRILDLGVEVRTGLRIGEETNLDDLLEEGFKALFLAIGAHKDRKLDIPGEDAFEGVVSAVSFLRGVNAGEGPEVGKKVAVIGGGNTAVDSARSALRLGAGKVTILYRRSEEEMPAAREEIEEAVEEGVEMAYLTAPVQILGQGGKVSALTCVRNELGEPDESGRRRPEAVPGSEFTLEVNTVVAAIGQAPDVSSLGSGVALSRGGTRIAAEDPDTLATSHPGIFAGGDAVTGPATAISAIAAGKRGAWGIDRYLGGKSDPPIESTERVEPAKVSEPVIEKTAGFSRCPKPSLAVPDRVRGFEEVASVFSEDTATTEALRCLHCHLGARVNQERCVSCLTCVRVCPLGIPKANKMGEITIDPVDCQACGMCVIECPVRAIDMSLHSPQEILEEVDKAMRPPPQVSPVIVGFFDLHGHFTAEDMARLRADHPNVIPLTVFGLRRISAPDVLRAFELGADAVVLAQCPEERDPFPETRDQVGGRTAQVSAILEALGLGGDRLTIWDMPEKGLVDKTTIEAFVDKIKEMGQGPLRV